MDWVKLLLDAPPPTVDAWGSSLKMLVSILLMFVFCVAAFIWWVRRG